MGYIELYFSMSLTKLTRSFLFVTSGPAAELVVLAFANESGVLGPIDNCLNELRKSQGIV